MDNSTLLWVAGQVIAAATIWGGIRIDIKNIHRQIEHNAEIAKSDAEHAEKSATDAHARIDRMLERKHS